MGNISENLKRINENIRRAEMKAGRPEGSVRLICVSKTVGEQEVREAVKCGQREFAENRTQLLREKQQALADLSGDIKWHLIGQLQTNKIKYCAGKVELIHSVDRIELAEAIGKYAGAHGLTVKGLLEVNISGEESKTGLPAAEVDRFLEAFTAVEDLELCGVMTMAPIGSDEKELRTIFAKARELEERIRGMRLPNAPMGELSMGMSGDYVEAVLEGATMVRIGTAVFA
ncbi:MAG: YggS family pyridoxal phosphate-dependent enzyme [Clostridia bacterium]|nr:YggS family pyridoxal phosphate-dependent enzyme [Clostridia bacterium]